MKEKANQPPRYTLRLAVKTQGNKPIIGIENEVNFNIAEKQISMRHVGAHLILKIFDFPSEQEAEQFLPQLKMGLWNLALKCNISFLPDFKKREISYSDNPEITGRNLAKAFGTQFEGPVHGLADEGGFSVYKDNEIIRFLGMGQASGSVSTNLEKVQIVLAAGVEQGATNTVSIDEQLELAFDLYLNHFYETSIRARFLTLMVVLEVLSPYSEKHAVVQKLLIEVQQKITELMQGETDEEALHALESLQRELEFRRETSIRRKIRQLILAQDILDQEHKTSLAKKVVQIYDLRGAIIHTGSVDPNELHTAYDIALEAMKLILQAKLGLLTST